MDLGLRGSRALITGGSRGIGPPVAALPAPGPRVTTAAADVTDTAALNGAVADAAEALGGLDHLVANVGGTIGGNLADAGPGGFTATFGLNAGPAAELIQAGLPHLRASGQASVVIISSITGMRPAPRTSYAVA